MKEKIFSTCPCCGSNLEIYSGDEGTNSFIAVDAKLLQPEEREVTVEEVVNILQEVEKVWEENGYKPDLGTMVSPRLLEVFEIRRKGE